MDAAARATAAAAGSWSIRAHVPIEVLSDTIQPFPSFSGIYDLALTALRMQIMDMPQPTGPMDAQMANLPVTPGR